MRKSIVGVLGVAAAVVAATTAGSLDTDFSTDGIVVDPTVTAGCVYDLAVQSDDQIVAVGQDGSNVGGDNYWRISRFDTDGTLDTGFGSGGDVVLFDDSSIAANRWAQDVAIDGSGRIVVVGIGYEVVLTGNGKKKKEQVVGGSFVVRLNSDGTLDTTFGDGGKVLAPVSESVLILSSGKILLGGGLTATSGGSGKGKKGGRGSSTAFALVRLNSDGTLDTTFGSDGTVLDDITTGDEAIFSMALESDGDIVAAGSGHLVRYDGDGDLDTSFGTNGRVVLASGDNGYVALDGSAGVLVADWQGTSLTRYTSAGVLDTNFGTGGVSTLPGPIWNEPVVQSDGKIIVGYEFLASTGNYDVAVTRLLTTGAVDTGFGAGGDGAGDAIDIGDAERMFALALDSQGRICCGGLTNAASFGGTPDEPDWFLARYCD